MTKPSDFIFNSDYLALAETGRQSFYVSVPSFGYDQREGFDAVTFYNVDLTTDEVVKGSIDEFYVTINGQHTFFGDTYSSLTLYPGPPGVFDDAHWFLELYRVNSKTIRVALVYIPELWSQGAKTDAITLNITVCSFRPPNVF